jgi:ParB/RepB/Spo0J family partition protein
MSSNTQTETAKVTEVRMVALERIKTRAGFNPRRGRDPEKFKQLVASVKADGVLAPVLVTPGDGEDLYLVAGEGRWLAAHEAGRTEVPVNVTEIDERTGGLELALVENMAREDVDPVQEAFGFERLREAGLTKKGIAERLGISQKRVTERLEILKVPAELHVQVADRTIPPAAVKALAALGGIHPELPAALVARVGERGRPWEPALTWAEAIDDPVGVLARSGGESSSLPEGVFELHESYPVEQFTLTAKADTQLTELVELLQRDREGFSIRFDNGDGERATSLGAGHTGKNGGCLIVGQDVADELAVGYVEHCLKTQRKNAESAAKPKATARSTGTADSETGEVGEEEAREQQREADRAARVAAQAHNAELGAAVLKHLARVKVDAGMLKILTAVDVADDLDKIAMRGARYGFPGWATETQQKNGAVKVEYIGHAQADAKAKEFLAGGTSVGELAGRLFCLIAMARYADEHAVPQSQRSFASIRPSDGVPYSGEVLELIDGICAERLPGHLTEKVRTVAGEARQAEAQRVAESEEAQGRLEAALAKESLTEEEAEQARADVAVVHGRYTPAGIDAERRIKSLMSSDGHAVADDVAEAA